MKNALLLLNVSIKYKNHQVVKLLPLFHYSTALLTFLFTLGINILIKTLYNDLYISIVEEYWKNNPQIFTLKELYPCFFAISFTLTGFLGIHSNLLYCSILTQRFSVPELAKHKIYLIFLNLVGCLTNVLILLLGISDYLLNFEPIVHRLFESDIPINEGIFMAFLICEFIYSYMSSLAMYYLQQKSAKKTNIAVKYFLVFMLLVISIGYVYIFRYNARVEYVNHLKMLLQYLGLLCYAFLSRTLYMDVRYVQLYSCLVVDEQYFVQDP